MELLPATYSVPTWAALVLAKNKENERPSLAEEGTRKGCFDCKSPLMDSHSVICFPWLVSFPCPSSLRFCSLSDRNKRQADETMASKWRAHDICGWCLKYTKQQREI